jgi:hypothetical protein
LGGCFWAVNSNSKIVFGPFLEIFGSYLMQCNLPLIPTDATQVQ